METRLFEWEVTLTESLESKDAYGDGELAEGDVIRNRGILNI